VKLLPGIIIMFALTGSASAQVQPQVEGATLFGSVVQTIAALAIVVGLILLFHYISNRWLRGALPVGSTQKYIRLIETRFLAPRKSLLLIEVGGEYLLLSSAGDSLQFIKQVDMMEEIEVIESPSFSKFVGDNFQNKIIDLVSRLPGKNGTVKPDRTSYGKAS